MADNIVITAELKDLISGHLKEITSQVNRLDGSLQNVGSRQNGGSGGFFGAALGANLLANAIGYGKDAILGFGAGIKDSLVNYEYFSTSVKTMLHGNVYAAKTLEAQLVSLAKTTPFELKDVQNGTKQLMAYGFAGSEVVGTLKRLGDVTAGLGSDKLPFIIRAFGQIKSKGHLAGQELNQLTEQGFNPLKIISDKTGKSYASLLKEMEKGHITFKDVEQTFKDVTSAGGQFYNLMEDQSKTVGGKLSALSDVWEQLRVNIGKSQKGIIGSTTELITFMASNINDKFSASNFLEDALSKTGVKGASGLSNLLGDFGFNTKGRENQGYAYAGEQMVSESKDSKDVLSNLKVLKVLQKQEQEKLRSALTSNDEFIRENALEDFNVRNSVFLETAKRLNGILDLNKNNPNSTKPDGTTPAISDLEKVAAANRPTQVNVNIENLVREYKPQVADNGKEVYKVTQEDVAKALLAAVNDASVMKFGS